MGVIPTLNITSLDFKNGQNLEYVYATDNNMQNVENINNLDSIEELLLYNNQLSGTFSIAEKQNLISLRLKNNNLTRIDVLDCPKFGLGIAGEADWFCAVGSVRTGFEPLECLACVLCLFLAFLGQD